MFQGRGPTGSAGLRGALLGTVAIRCLADGFVKQLPICLPCDTVSICASTTKKASWKPGLQQSESNTSVAEIPTHAATAALQLTASARRCASCLVLFPGRKGLEKL